MASFIHGYKPKPGGVRKIMRSKGVQGVVGDAAEELAAAATSHSGAVYGSRVRLQTAAAKGYVYTGNYADMRDQAENGTLSSLV